MWRKYFNMVLEFGLRLEHWTDNTFVVVNRFLLALYYWHQNNWIYIRIASANVHNSAIIKSFLVQSERAYISSTGMDERVSQICGYMYAYELKRRDFLITKYNAKSVVFMNTTNLLGIRFGALTAQYFKSFESLYEIKISFLWTQNVLKICV